MERLTTDKPENNLQTVLNLFYAKDGQAWVRGGGPWPKYPDVTLNDNIRRAIKLLATCPQLFDELDDQKLSEAMADWYQDGAESHEGLIGMLYTAGWVCAELRARLKEYEDTELSPAQVVKLRWIPVERRLPGAEEVKQHYQRYGEHPRYIAMIKHALFVAVLSYDGEMFYDSVTNEPYAVTHWMPLPAAPEEECA